MPLLLVSLLSVVGIVTVTSLQHASTFVNSAIVATMLLAVAKNCYQLATLSVMNNILVIARAVSVVAILLAAMLLALPPLTPAANDTATNC